MFLKKDDKPCTCVPAGNEPTPYAQVITIRGVCEHGEGVAYTPQELWGDRANEVTVTGVLHAISAVWHRNEVSRHVSKYEIAFLATDGNGVEDRLSFILEYAPSGLHTLLWNPCPEGGYHSYVSVLEWAAHFVGLAHEGVN